VKAVVIHEFGNSDVLRLEELPDPTAGPGEVVIEIAASALNHLDVDVREGVSRFPVSFPHALGLEVVGRVTEVGASVTGWAPGDRAMVYIMGPCGRCRYCATGRESLCLEAGFVSGGYAERLACPASQLIPVPDAIPDNEAAALQIAFGTAWHMLFTRGGLRAGETVLVNSVGSGIGSAAVQLAHLAGAFVIGTSSRDDKLEQAAALGMDAGINYTTSDVVEEVQRITGGDGADLTYEHAGGELFQHGLDALKKDGRLVTCGAHAGEVVPFDIIPFFRRQLSVIGSFVYTRDEVARCLSLVARGLVKPIVAATFPLEQAKEAMDLMESREFFGKILLTPGGAR
jgi:NADPH:quinone reductase-like Zn-dependent oxidoreductase